MDLVAEKLIKYQSREKNILKAVEECAELQEVLVKLLTKGESTRPKIEKIIEEAGDVMFRIYVLTEMLGITDKTFDRTEQKAEFILKWVEKTFENKN